MAMYPFNKLNTSVPPSILFAAILFCLPGTCSTSSPPSKPVKPPEHSLSFGVYQIYWQDKAFEKNLSNALALLPEKPAVIMFFRDLHKLRGFPLGAVKIIDKTGAVPMVSLELNPWGDAKSKVYLPAILAGEYDAFFETWAKDCKAWGKPVLFRPGFEMNGSWFSWSGNPKQFIAVWRYMHKIFQAQGCSNAKWVWSPGVESFPDEAWNQLEKFYPGDAFVDWLGLDGYNWGTVAGRPELRWKSFQEIFSSPLKRLAKLAPSKPIMIAEIACNENDTSSKAAWIQKAITEMKHIPHLKLFIWFNYDKRPEKENDWRFNSSTQSLDAFRAGIKNSVPLEK